MKKLLIILISSALFICCSDNDESTPIVDGNQEISIDSETIVFGMDGEVAAGLPDSVIVTSTNKWRLVGDTSWCAPVIKKGTDKDTIRFTAKENIEKIERSVVFTLICGNAVAKLTVHQLLDKFVDYSKMPDTFSYNMVAAGGNITLRLASNLDTDNYVISDDWIAFRPGISTSAEKWMQFVIAPQASFSDRTGTITLFKGTKFEKAITVVQERFYGVITDDPIKYDVGVAAGTIDITVRGNVSFSSSVSSSYSAWLSCAEISSSGTDVIEKTFRISYTASEYSRNGIVTITPTKGTAISFTVAQENPNPELFEVPDNTFAGRLTTLGYIVAKDGKYYMTYSGYNATTLSFNNSAYSAMASVEGIERFVNLTSLTLSYCKVKKLDLSKNTKITSLTNNYIALEELILADLPLTTRSITYLYNYYSTSDAAQSFKLSSSKVTTLTLNQTSNTTYDKLESIDITGSPALTTLSCNRSSGVLKNIYVTQAQKDAYDAGTLKITTNTNFPVSIIVK